MTIWQYNCIRLCHRVHWCAVYAAYTTRVSKWTDLRNFWYMESRRNLTQVILHLSVTPEKCHCTALWKAELVYSIIVILLPKTAHWHDIEGHVHCKSGSILKAVQNGDVTTTDLWYEVHVCTGYKLWVKKQDTVLLFITVPDVDLFSKFFHC